MAELICRPEKIAEDHILLRIHHECTCEPGQFINIRITEFTDPLIRRPFSIHDYSDGIISVIVRLVGKGTHMLSNFNPGPVDILGPLGKGFTTKNVNRALLVGGGVGNAPLYYLAKRLKNAGTKVTMLYAAKKASYLYCLDEFKNICDKFHICTDDGTEGICGLPHEILPDLIKTNEIDRAYICGPTIMMKMVSGIIDSAIPVEVSLENYFGCGIGLCMGCTVETTGGLKRACKDGPVFNSKSLVWDNLSE